MENLDTKKQLEEEKNQLWDEIGFHRPLAGFWHNLGYQLLIIIIPAIFAGVLLNLLYPFPTSKGYKDTFEGIFVLIFQVFDLGTASTISRFVAAENIKNPGKMVKYIQYFIWYQMVTGLIQVTGISIWALYFAKNTQLVYGIWIMLVIVTKQWPGFPGVFKGIMGALQMYNKKNTIEFLQGEGIQRFTEIGFVLLGRWYGINHPEIGEIMGIAIGATFGLYFDDIIATFVAAHILSKSLTPYGITFKRMFMIEFDWDIVKECTIFGVKMGFPGLIYASVQLFSLTLCLNYISQYTTYASLRGFAYSFSATTDRLVYQDFTSIYTEAYQNGKIKLCQYYNAHVIRFFMINTGFAVSIMLIVISITENLFIGMSLDQYMAALPFLIPALALRAFNPYKKYPSNILVAAHKPSLLMIISFVEEGLKILAWYLTLVVFRVQDLGVGGVVYAVALTEFPVYIFRFFFSMTYINKKIFKLKYMKWQSFGAPIIATLILVGMFNLLKALVLDLLWAWSFVGTIVIGFAVILILVLVFYFPLTVVLGGWDKNSISDLHKAVKMSGFSKILVKPMTNMVFRIAPHSKLHNRFPYDETEALQEVKELVALREEGRKKIKEEI